MEPRIKSFIAYMSNTGNFMHWYSKNENLAEVVRACSLISPHDTLGFEIYAQLSDDRQVLLPENLYLHKSAWLPAKQIKQPSIKTILKSGKVFEQKPIEFKIPPNTWDKMNLARQACRTKAETIA